MKLADYKLCETRNGFMLVNPRDLGAGRSFDVYGEWLAGEQDVLEPLVLSDHMVLDVGAGIGGHTVWLARLCGQVLAFEPQRLLFQQLNANVALNGLVNVQTLQAAVGHEAGVVRVPDLDPDLEVDFGAFYVNGHDHGLPVGVITIDDFELPRCDLIKVDVNGLEASVLAGARKTIERLRPTLVIRDEREDKRPQLVAMLQDMEYEVSAFEVPLFRADNVKKATQDLFSGVTSRNLLCCPSDEPGEQNLDG